MVRIIIKNAVARIDHTITADNGEQARDKLLEWLQNCAFLAHGDHIEVVDSEKDAA